MARLNDVPKVATRKASVLDKCRHNISYYTLTLFVVVLVYAVFWGVLYTILTTIEKRYSFPSWQSGIIVSASEYGRVAALLPVSYFGGRGHIPRVMCAFLSGCAVASLLMASPNFFLDPGKGVDLAATNVTSGTGGESRLSGLVCFPDGPANSSHDSAESTSESDDRQTRVSSSAFAIFLSAMVILGLCASPKQSLTFSYVDSNATTKQSPLHISIIHSANSFGPTIGAFLAAWTLTFYVDLTDPGISTSHPDWVGAWWIPLVMVSVGLFVTVPFIACFPRTMRRKDDNHRADTGDNRDHEMVEMFNGDTQKNVAETSDPKNTRGKTLHKDFLRTTWRIAKNPIFASLTLTRLPQAIALWGYYGFLAKYIEVQFSSPTWTANVISGVAILCISLAKLASGGAITYFKLSYRRTTQLLAGLTVVSFVVVMALMFVGCPDVKVADGDVVKNCVETCYCDVGAVSPVCDVNEGLSYLTACQAGCVVTMANSSTAYSGCACAVSGHVTPGLCASCSTLPAYISLVLIYFTARGLALSPMLCVTLRSVDEIDRSLALGLNSLIVALAGWLPAPIVYGLVIDKSCDLWQMLGSTRGYCQIYNRSDYRYNIHGISLGLCGVELVLIAVSLFFINRRRITWETNTTKNPEL